MEEREVSGGGRGRGKEEGKLGRRSLTVPVQTKDLAGAENPRTRWLKGVRLPFRGQPARTARPSLSARQMGTSGRRPTLPDARRLQCSPTLLGPTEDLRVSGSLTRALPTRPLHGGDSAVSQPPRSPLGACCLFPPGSRGAGAGVRAGPLGRLPG